MIYSRITGTGSYFPEKVLTNDDLSKIVDTSDEWITARTGIKQRHISSKDEANSDMIYKAALNAIDMAGIKLSEIDGIITPTVTPDYCFPPTASVVQQKLGLHGCFTMDVNAVCTGFIYALNLADSLIKTGKYKNILIAAGERLSTIVDYNDRGTCILFGDGAGCAVVSADCRPGVLSCNMGADGQYGDLLYMHGMGSTFLANRDTMKIEDNLIKMKGNDIFKLAVRAMTEASEKAIAESGLKPEDIDFLVPHQANIRIMEAVVKRFGMSFDKVLMNIEKRGNTSSPTIPTTLDEAIRSGMVKQGDNLAMCAFGGGLTWGAAVVTL